MLDPHARRRSVVVATIAVSTLASAAFVLEGLRVLRSEPASALSDAALLDRGTSGLRAPSGREVGVRVLARNIFDSQTGPLSWEEASAPPPASGSGGEGEVPAPSALPAPCDAAQQLRLVAAVVNSVRPEQSFAALRVQGKTHLLGIGGQVDDVTLLALRPSYAYVRHGAVAACTLPVFLPPGQRPKAKPPAAKAPRPAAPARPKRKPLFSEQEITSGVRSLGGGRYAVSRSLLMRALRSPTGASLGARMRPVERYGRTVGWELARLRKGSALARMGLQKGDLLRSVNGHELSDASTLLVALRMLQQADSVTLAITRGNAVQHLQYTLD